MQIPRTAAEEERAVDEEVEHEEERMDEEAPAVAAAPAAAEAPAVAGAPAAEDDGVEEPAAKKAKQELCFYTCNSPLHLHMRHAGAVVHGLMLFAT